MKEGKWKQGDAATSILSDQPKRNKSVFRYIGLVLLVTNLSTWLQCFIKNALERKGA